MDLVGDPADGVGDSLEDDNSSKPAVDQVHGVERDTGKLDDWVVAASQEEERNHVHHRHDTGTAEELTSTGREAAVVDLPDAESNVDGKVADQEEALETAGQGANANSRGHLELAVVTSAPEGCIQARLLEAGIVVVGDRKVALGLVVEARHCAYIADEVENDLVKGKHYNEAPPDAAEVILHIDVLKSSGGVLLAMSCALGKPAKGL